MNTEVRERIINANASPSQTLAFNIEPVQESGLKASVIYTARNLLPSLFGPFPWQWRGFSWIAAGIDGIIMFAVLALALAPFVIRRINGAKVASILWIGAMPIILGNSLALANYGIAMRVRANIALILLPVAAYSMSQIYSQLRLLRSKPNGDDPPSRQPATTLPNQVPSNDNIGLRNG
jgi:hypothetical protein